LRIAREAVERCRVPAPDQRVVAQLGLEQWLVLQLGDVRRQCVATFSATGVPDGVNVAASVCSCAPSRLNANWLPTYAAVSVVASLKRQRALAT
jgi:hypothetical protein